MLKIPSRILLPYDELLVKTAVPERSHFLYKKWLRYNLNESGQVHTLKIDDSSWNDRVYTVFMIQDSGFVTVFAPDRTRYLLSGDGRAVFEVMLHWETLKIRLKAQGVRFKVQGSRFKGTGFVGYRSNYELR